MQITESIRINARRLLCCLLLLISDICWSDNVGVLQSFPETGAFSATHREDREAISVIEFAGNYDHAVSGNSNVEPRAVVAREFFRTHADNYDFLVVFTAFEFNSGSAAAFHWRLQNQVQGIGLPQYDNSNLFGSNGRLLGYTDMAALSRWVMDPMHPGFETLLSVLGHELMHQWSGNVRFNQGGGEESGLLGKDGSHWSNLLDTDASVLYGHDWHNNGDGTFTSVARRKFFSPLDLYLAGFYRADEVPPMTLIVNSALNTAVTPEESLLLHGTTVNGAVRTINVNDIIAVEGERLPPAVNAQKQFRTAFIVLAGANQPVSQQQIAAVDAVRRAFVDRFSIWTGGRATVNAFPESLPENTVGAPDVISGGEVRPDDVDIAQGFAWLRAQQALEGFWRDKETTTLRDSAVTLDVLSQYDPVFNRRNDALDWIAAQQTANVDYLARQASMLGRVQSSEQAAILRARLLALRNSDGGWGFDAGFDSDPLDTALALRALIGHTDVPGTVIAKASDYLIAQQNVDGGWSNRPGSPSRTSVTATVLKALQEARRPLPEQPNAVAFLVGRQNPDGGFGDSPSTVHDTANVLQILTEMEALDQVRPSDAADYLLLRQTVDGNWEGSTYSTALALAALQRFNFTNWAVISLNVDNDAPTDGDRVKVTVSLRNNTAVEAPPGLLRIFAGDNQIGGDINVPVLRSGQTFAFTMLWDTLDYAGERVLMAVVDPDNAQPETSERDNEATVRVMVGAAPAGVDLQMTAGDVAVIPAAPMTLPAELGFAATVRNTGLTDAAAVRVQLRSGSPAGPVLGEQVVDINNRSSAAVNFSYTLTSPGTARFYLVADPGNQIAESREDNNIAERVVNTAASVDLAVANSDIGTDMPSSIIGEDVRFTIQLHNRGTLAAPSTRVRYSITDGTTTTEILSNSVQLEAGQSKEQTVVWRVDRQGTLTFTVQIDPDNLLPELDEANNVASINFTVGQANGPNLVVSFNDFTFEPQPGLEARPLTLNALLRNTGTQSADNIEVAFYNGDPAQGGALIGVTQTVAMLAAGESTTVSLLWSAVPDAQEKLLFVVADPNDAIAEFSEEDNRAFNTLKILSLSDLAVSADDIILSPAFPADGDTVDVSVRVTNLGQQAATMAVVRIFNGDPERGGVQIGGDQLLDLAGNAAGVVNVSYTLEQNISSTQQLTVQLDPDNQILEQTKLNNTATREFLVQDGDFAVSQRYISPNGDGVQDASAFFFRLPQAGDVEVVIVNERGETVRRYSGDRFTAIDYGQVSWDGLDELGRVVRDGLYRLQVRGLDGGSVFGEAIVTVDTNRLPLMQAVGTPYASYTNLTCQIPGFGDFTLSENGESFLYRVHYATEGVASGIYRADDLGRQVTPVVFDSAFSPGTIEEITVADDLSQVALEVSVNTIRQLWIVEGNGANLRQLSRPNAQSGIHVDSLRFAGADNQFVLAAYDNVFYTIPVDGEEPVVLADFSSEYLVAQTLSPDRRRLLVDTANTSNYTRRLVMLDIEAGTAVDVASVSMAGTYPADAHYWKFSWSPDGTRIAVLGSASYEVSLFDNTGRLLNVYPVRAAEVEPDRPDVELYPPVWSTVSNELGLIIKHQADCCESDEQGGLYLLNLDTAAVQLVYAFNDESPRRLASFHDSPMAEKLAGIFDMMFPAAFAQETINPSGQVTDFFWAPHERSWIYRSSRVYDDYIGDVFAFSFTGNEIKPQPYRVFYDYFQETIAENIASSKDGRQLLLYSDLESSKPNSTCIGNGRDAWSFRSLMNLTADLRAIRSARVGGILLSGTAADVNFRRYQLEYAFTDAPDAWRPIQPASGQTVLDGPFTAWVPPAPGSYFVRLTVTDLAGNQRQKIKRVSWAETPAITDLYRTPDWFSPNGDGIADLSTIQYRTLTPVHLEFNFYDAQNRLVRTVVRDHAEVGQTFQFNWDGRDNAGVVLPDGEYRMTVQNYEFFFHIDATFPVATLRVQDAYQPRQAYSSDGALIGVFASVQPRVVWSVADQNYTDSAIEWAFQLNPNSWQPFYDPDPIERGLGTVVDKGLGLSTALWWDIDQWWERNIDEVSGRAYRVVAEDRAGNRTVIQHGPAAEQLIVTEFGHHEPNPKLERALALLVVSEKPITFTDYRHALENTGGWFNDLRAVQYAEMGDPDGVAPPIPSVPGEVRFHVHETIAEGVSTLRVQYRLLSESEWRSSMPDRYFSERELTSVDFIQGETAPDIAYYAVWQTPADINENEVYAIRLQASDSEGRTYLSNTFRAVFRSSIIFNGLRRQAVPEDRAHLIDPLLEEKPADDEYVLWGRVFSSEPISTVRVFVSSAEDPRYALEQEIGVFHHAVHAYAVKTKDLTSCKNYRARVVGRNEPSIDPDSGEQRPGVEFRVEESFKVPCLSLYVAVEPVVAPACDLPSPQQLRIKFSPVSEDHKQLRLLTLSTEDSQNVIFNVNEPTPAPPPLFLNDPLIYNYEFILDTSAMAEGVREFQARLVNEANEEIHQSVVITVDHTPPVASINFPASGAAVCGVQREVGINGQAQTFNVLAMEGVVADNTGAGYFVDFNAGGEHDPILARRFHDSNPLIQRNSFNAASAKPWTGEDSFATSSVIAGIAPDLRISRVAGPLAELFNMSGEFTTRLHAYDWGGHHLCVDRVFEFDGEVRAVVAESSPPLFSPNGDGIADETAVNYTLEESANLTVDVYLASTDARGRLVITGSVIRGIEDRLPVLPGSAQVVWDGTNNAGNAVADGWYGIRLSLTDSCGNQRQFTRFVEVDNTPPAVSVLFPTAASQLPLMVEVQGTVTDAHLHAYTVEFGSGSEPETWLSLADGRSNIDTPEVLAIWNTFGMQGAYTLRVAANDTAGNTAEVRVPLQLTEPLNLISLLEAVEPLFSPNGDGRRENTALRFELDETVMATLTVQRDGVTVRTLLADQLLQAGPRVLSWGGRDNAGVLLGDGVYQVQLRAVLESDALVTQTEQITVTIDTTAPNIVVTQPATGFVQPGSSVIGSINDVRLSEYVLQLTDKPERPLWHEIASGNANRGNVTLALLDPALEGTYALRVSAEDRAENRSEQVIPFSIDKTPPQVTLTAPQDGAYVRAAEPVDVSGDLVEANPASYRIEAISVGGTVIAIDEGQSFPLPSVVTQWDVSALEDGPYSLGFSVTDLAGLSGRSQVNVIVDNTPPVAEIAAPTAGAYLTIGTAINGTASDLNLAEYRLALAPGQPAESQAYSLLGSGTASINDGLLLSTDLLPQDGQYTLRLTVADRAGNTAEAMRPVIVDTTPPAAPTGLVAEMEGDNIRLRWSANTELDLAGYRVFSDGRNITPEAGDPISAIEYLDVGIAQGRRQYTVRALDLAGNVSKDSMPVVVVVDTAPPTARIAWPAMSSEVSGLVDIRGTAHSAEDFKEYRLYVAATDTPDVRQLLRRSPAPVQNDTLSEWNTVALPEGAMFVIRLEAEDINGNIATVESTVSIDNLPPAAPTGLTAVAEGANGRLSWNANTEEDLLGYLLFRNDRIANAIGTVVGDLQPFAIADTNYLDLELADGPYVYTVIAMDDAGNMSDPSLPADILIDTRAPQALIMQPADGSVFEQPQYVLAVSEDTDIAEVLIQYRAIAANTWLTLESDNELPYDADLDPVQLGLGYGEYQLRAVATDLQGQTDPEPSLITITYRDLTAPATVVDLIASVNGGDVSLSWRANTELDLAGYHIDRVDLNEQHTRLTAEPLQATTYLDGGLADDTYRYTITAVDMIGNEAAASAEAAAVVYTPILEPLFIPTADSMATISGSGITQASVSATVVSDAGAENIGPFASDAGGGFSFAAPLQLNTNTVTIRMTDPAGNVSKPVITSVVRGDIPSQPTGLQGVANDLQVNLNWNANPEPNIVGYRVYRSDEAVLVNEQIEELSAIASYEYSFARAANIIDRSNNTYWEAPWPYEDHWISVRWVEPRLVASIILNWQWYIARNYDIEARFQDQWVTLAQVRNAVSEQQHSVSLPKPYMTTELRLVLREQSYIRLSELEVFSAGLISGIAYTDPGINGVQEYTVTAVNAFGFESVPSDPAEIAVGDVTPPEPVTLMADVNGADVALSWTASASNDIAFYDLYRDGQLLERVDDLNNRTYNDIGLPNATYRYTVVAVDQRDNRSQPSNEAAATIDVLGSFNLTVVAEPAGSALTLNWQPPVALQPDHYTIYRATVSGGPYQQVATVAASVTVYTDTPLQNTIEYFYSVIAMDDANARSTVSIEASGTPLDVVAPAIQLLAPTRAGSVFTTTEAIVDVGGSSSPGARITLFRDGKALAETTAIMQPDVIEVGNNLYDPRLSPDGRFVVGEEAFNLPTLVMYDLETNQRREIVTGQSYHSFKPRWRPGGQAFVYIHSQSLSGGDARMAVYEYRFTSSESVQLTNPLTSEVYAADYSPSGDHLAVVGQFDNGGTPQEGLWLVNLDTLGRTLLQAGNSYNFDLNSIQWSPGSDFIAYVDSSIWPQRLRIVDVDTLDIRNIEVQRSVTGVDWSADGRNLVYSAYDPAFNGNQVILQSTLASDTIELLAGSIDQNYANPQWSPDNSAVAYYTDGGLEVLDIANGQTLFRMGDIANLWQWSESGHILANWAFTTDLRIALPGYFNFDAVALKPGDNVFTATAEDDAGNISDESESIIVNFSMANRPDLVVVASDIRVLPEVPSVESVAKVAVTVRNVGNGNSAPTLLSMLAVDPSGERSTLLVSALVNALPPGGMQTFNSDWVLGNKAGQYALVATVDPDDIVPEISEANNTVVAPRYVTGAGGLALTVGTDAPVYSANQPVIINAQLVNSGESFAGAFSITIKDEQGVEVTRLLEESVANLVFGGIIERKLAWNTASVFAGNYQVVIEALDSANNSIASASSTFTIRPLVQLETTVATDSSRYGGNSNVRIIGTIQHVGGNSILAGAAAQLRILNANSELLATSDQSLIELLPSDHTSVSMDWSTGLQPVGEYRVELLISLGQALLSEASTIFYIEDAQSVEVTGSLTLNNRFPSFGEVVLAQFGLQNAGNTAITQLPTHISLIDPERAAVLQTEAVMINIGANGNFSDTISFATAFLASKTYNILLQVEQQSGLQTLAVASFTPQDRVPPSVSLRVPMAGALIGGNTDAVISAVDERGTVAVVVYQIDGGQWQTALPRNLSVGEYGGALMGLVDGSHTLRARATDAAGNTGFSDVIIFAVDNTPPMIDISGVSDGMLTNTTVTPVITIIDANSVESAVLLNGQSFISGTAVINEGSYELQVVATDAAGNTARASLQFAIDMTPPQIDIIGIEEGKAYNSVAPEIIVTDANPDTQHIILGEKDPVTLEVSEEDFISGTWVTEEGYYLIRVTARDKAGNFSEREINFVIDPTLPPMGSGSSQGGTAPVSISQIDDRTPPQIDISGVTEGGAYNTFVMPEIMITDVDLGMQLITLNGEEFISGTSITAEGRYLLRVAARDNAGHSSEREVRFTIDYTAPGLAITSPQTGDVVDAAMIDVVGHTEPGAIVILRGVDDGPSMEMADSTGAFIFAGVALTEGQNVFSFTAADAADNRSDVVTLTIQRLSASQVSLVGEISNQPRVLVWLPSVSVPLGRLLIDVFTASGIDYKLTDNEAAFREALYSQRYNIAFIADVRAVDEECSARAEYQHAVLDDPLYQARRCQPERLHVSQALREDLKLSIASGLGLVMISTYADNANLVREVMGVQSENKIVESQRVALVESPLGAARSLSFTGQGVALRVADGLVVGRHMPHEEPMLVIHTYLGGNTVMMGFDPAELDQVGQAKMLLNGVINFVAPRNELLLAGGVTGLNWLVSNAELQSQYRLLQLSDERIGLLSAIDGEIIDATSLNWQCLLETATETFSAVIQLPVEKGEYVVTAELFEMQDSITTSLLSAEFLLSIQRDRDDIGATLLSAMYAVEALNQYDALKLQNAIRMIEQVMASDFTSKQDIGSALRWLVAAYNNLEGMDMDLQPIQQNIGRLHRAYQLEWHQIIKGE